MALERFERWAEGHGGLNGLEAILFGTIVAVAVRSGKGRGHVGGRTAGRGR